MTDKYSNVELVEMVRLYAISGNSLRGGIRMFKEMFPDRPPPSQSVMMAATQRLRDYRQFDVPRHAQARGSVGLPVALQEDILEYFQREPGASMREAGRHFGVHYTTVFRLLQRELQQPFHHRKNEESTSENDTIHVFCPKCNTKVPHTAEGIQQDQTKMLIAKVYHYFEQEYEDLKKIYGHVDLSPLSKFRQRTALATGVSDSMLQQILEEERRREEEERTPRAHKRRRQEDSSVDETSDDSDGDAEGDNDVQEPAQPYDDVQEEGEPYAATETLVVKIEQPEFNIDEPEVFVPAPLKEEPGDYDDYNEQVTTDPISLDIKTEPQDDEIAIVTQELNKPGTSKYKERKRTRTSQNTSSQPIVTQELTKPGTSKHKERKRTRTSQNTSTQSRLLDETEEIDVNGEGYS